MPGLETKTGALGASRPRRSLSSRLLGLTVLVVLLTEILVFLLGLSREQRAWLNDRVTNAHIAALAVAAAPDGMVDAKTRNELLRLSEALEIRVSHPGQDMLALEPDHPPLARAAIDLRDPDAFGGVGRALIALVRNDDRLVTLTAASAFEPDTVVELVIRQRSLSAALRTYARNFIQLALLIAGVTGVFVYVAVLVLLVRPMRRIVNSIAAFRADPERTTPLDPNRVTRLDDGEMAVAGRELASMQHELRAALWRNARLAALGTALAKISHDLRNILAPALMAAERLQTHTDPLVRRSSDTLVRAVDRATDLISRTLSFAREGPPPPARGLVNLRQLVDEASESIGANGHCRVDNRISSTVHVDADDDQLLRVLVNLLRNAEEAGARRVSVALAETQSAGEIALEIADDGPGLPADVEAALFRPFVQSAKHGGTGLGLAIARDLMRAHGGDIALARTGRNGTVFRLTLPGILPEPVERARVPAEAGDLIGRSVPLDL
jgi:signal transduction histidine kinase